MTNKTIILLALTFSMIFITSCSDTDDVEKVNESYNSEVTETNIDNDLENREQEVGNMGERPDMGGDFEEMKEIMDKKNNGEELTDEEESLLEEFETNMPEGEMGTPPERR